MTFKRNRSKKIAVIDFETDPFLWNRVPYPFVCGYYDGEEYREFWGKDFGLENRDDIGANTALQIAEFLADRKEIVYAHNGGKFDFFYLLEHIQPDIMTIHSRIAKMMIGQCELRDSWLILPLPLSSHDKDTDFDYDLMEYKARYRPHNQALISEYLRRDCVSLYEWVTKFIGRFGRKLTLASAAFDQLKLTGYPMEGWLNGNETIEIKNDDEQNSQKWSSDSMFRQFYFGGRVEAISPGKHAGTVEYVDINSAYSYAMLHIHPVGNRFVEQLSIPQNPYQKPYFAKIVAVSRGALPFRNDHDHSLSFPRDAIAREYLATGWEIQAGLDTGTLEIIEVKKCYTWLDYCDFSDYVNKFFEEKKTCRATGDIDNETFAKFMLNGCYGRFGLNPRKFTKMCITKIGDVPPEIEIWSKLRDDYDATREKMNGFASLSAIEKESAISDIARVVNEIKHHFGVDDEEDIEELFTTKGNGFPLGWQLIQDNEFDKSIWEKPDPGKQFFNVAIAASITGFVRAYLWRALCQCEEPLYCDTDAIMTRKFNGKRGVEIGEWKIEAIFDELHIAGKKMYAGKLADDYIASLPANKADKVRRNPWKIASKGVKLSHEEIARVAAGETVEYRKIAPTFSLKFKPIEDEFDEDGEEINHELQMARFLKRKIKREK